MGAPRLLRGRYRVPHSISARASIASGVHRLRDKIIADTCRIARPKPARFGPLQVKSHSILRHRCLETFLPFDLENLFSSFFILSVISAILPDTLPDPSYRDMGYSLLDAMIERGNRVAQLRKSEVELLEELIAPLMRRQGRSTGIGNDNTARPHLATPTSQGRERLTESVQPSGSGLLGEIGGSGIPPPHEISEQDDEIPLDWRGLGLSLDCMLTAADQLNTNNLVLDAEREGLQTDLWLWES